MLSRRTVFLALSSISLVSGYSQFIVDSGKPKCITAEIPRETFVKLHYEAPDIMLDKENKDYGPTFITITENHHMTSAAEKIREELEKPRHPRRKDRVLESNKRQHKSHELLSRKGFVGHRGVEDAQVNICIRASLAGSQNPMRFGLRLEEVGDEATPDLPSGASKEAVDEHLSFLESSMERLESQMHAMIREAEFSKDRDAVYHSRTDAMHKATIFWPIVHVGILLVTGFTQANHIVQFFKKRRII